MTTFTRKQAIEITRVFPIERLALVADWSGKRPRIRGLKTQPVLGEGAVLLIHPNVAPWRWRALVGLHRG